MISHINGVPTPPSKTDPEFTQWQQADDCVSTWLVQNLEAKLVNRVSKYPTAKGIWDSLAVTYASGGDSIQVHDLHRRATLLKQQKGEPLEEVWASLQDIWVSIDHKRPNPMESPRDIELFNQFIEEQRVHQFLIALDDTHEAVKKEILRTQPLPSAEATYAILRSEDARASILKPGDTGPVQGIGAGLAARTPWQNPSTNRSFPQRGGSSGGWPKRGEEDRSKLLCTHCGKKKHTKETCFELHGYPEWWEERKAARQHQPQSKGKAAAALAVGDGGSAATVGSNLDAASNRGGGRPGAPAEGEIGVATIARGGAENLEMGEGNLGFEDDLSLNPHNFWELKSEPYPIIYPKKNPPDLAKMPNDPQTSICSKFQSFKTKKYRTNTQEARNNSSAQILCKNRFQALENLPQSYALSVSSEPKIDKWIFDCGATDTITYDKSDIPNMHRAPKSHIQTANGELSVVEGA